jgi:hypothetical protein
LADSAVGTMVTDADCVPRGACKLTSRSDFAKGSFDLWVIWE